MTTYVVVVVFPSIYVQCTVRTYTTILYNYYYFHTCIIYVYRRIQRYIRRGDNFRVHILIHICCSSSVAAASTTRLGLHY